MRPSHQQAQRAGQPPGERIGERIGERHVRGVYHFIYRHVGNREEAEALTERACLLATQPPAPSEETSLERRLAQIARMVVGDYLRALYPSSLAFAADDIVEWSDSADGDGYERVPGAEQRAERILAQLPAQDREFLTYRFLDNGSLAETAARMRLTLAQALALQWSALSHATQIMAQQTTRRPASYGADGGLCEAPC